MPSFHQSRIWLNYWEDLVKKLANCKLMDFGWLWQIRSYWTQEDLNEIEIEHPTELKLIETLDSISTDWTFERTKVWLHGYTTNEWDIVNAEIVVPVLPCSRSTHWSLDFFRATLTAQGQGTWKYDAAIIVHGPEGREKGIRILYAPEDNPNLGTLFGDLSFVTETAGFRS